VMPCYSSSFKSALNSARVDLRVGIAEARRQRAGTGNGHDPQAFCLNFSDGPHHGLTARPERV
jgi:hypothetical protein